MWGCLWGHIHDLLQGSCGQGVHGVYKFLIALVRILYLYLCSNMSLLKSFP